MEFYGQWNPKEDEVVYKNYFEENPKAGEGFYIECGAGSHGLACLFFEKHLGWKGINIEASPLKYLKLIDYRPNSFNLCFGLSDKCGIKTFTDVIKAPGGGAGIGSFSFGKNLKKQLDGWKCEYHDFKILTSKLMNILPGINRIDFFSLDADGHDLQVIKGMRGARILPEIMSVEYPVVGFNNIKRAMEDLGYIYNFVSFNNAFFSHIKRDSWFGATKRMEDI
jgi:hypothetical protein